MAANSKREQIISALVSKVEDLSSVKTVKRIQPSDVDELSRYSAQQLPLVAIIGGVPVPVEHKKGRGPGGVDVIISDLMVDFYGYFMDNTTPDSTLSSLMDDIWVAIYADQTLGDLALGMTIRPRAEIAVWDPYYAFSLTSTIQYHHTTGGI